MKLKLVMASIVAFCAAIITTIGFNVMEKPAEVNNKKKEK